MGLFRAAFRRDAEAALAASPHLGPGTAYRVVASMRRKYFKTPKDTASWYPEGRRQRGSKLIDAPAYGRER